MSKYKSIYDNPAYRRGVRDRLIRTAGQVLLASAAASLFTGAGLITFVILLGVTLASSFGMCLAFPEKVLLGDLPETDSDDRSSTDAQLDL